MHPTYWVESGDLWVASGDRVSWRGRPDAKPVLQAVAIPGTDDAVVLLDPGAGPRTALGHLQGWPHLLRVRPDGRVVWRAWAGRSPGDADWWSGVRSTGADVEAGTWSGYRRTIDPESGRVLSSVFVK